MKPLRRRTLTALAIVSATLAMPVLAQAQTTPKFPTRAVKIIVGYSAGTTSDVFARIVAQRLSDRWAQPVIVENRDGAAGSIGADLVAKAAPDGYTLHLTSNAFTLGPLLRKQLPYDPFNDFVALTQVAQTPNILLVGPNLGVKDLKGYLELAKSGKLQYASSGRGTPSHITVELFKSMANVSIEEIPYKSSGQALTDTLSGQVSLNAPGIAQGLPFVRGGRAVALGITGSKRAPGAADIPTLAEAGVPGYEAYGWHGVFAPAKTPVEIVRFLESELRAVLSTAEARETFAKSGAEVVAGTSAEFTAFLRTDFAKWKKLFGQLAIQPE